MRKVALAAPTQVLWTGLTNAALDGLYVLRHVFGLQICQSDYKKDLLEWIDADNLPDWLGGRSKGTLLDDVGPWSDADVLRRMEGQLNVAAKALKRISAAVSAVSGTEGQLLVLDNELADGYHSPRWGGWHGCLALLGCCTCWAAKVCCWAQHMPAPRGLHMCECSCSWRVDLQQRYVSSCCWDRPLVQWHSECSCSWDRQG